jgi:Na+/H+-dicarboxylate symporter
VAGISALLCLALLCFALLYSAQPSVPVSSLTRYIPTMSTNETPKGPAAAADTQPEISQAQPTYVGQPAATPTATSGEKVAGSEDFKPVSSPSQTTSSEQDGDNAAEEVKKPWWHSVKEPGSATQIIIAAALAIGIGMAIVATVDDIPQAEIDIVGIPGRLWLRALKAVVLPLIITAIIISTQRLKALAGDSKKLASWTIGYYVLTTVLAIVISTLLTAFVWGPRFKEADKESLAISEAEQKDFDSRPKLTISQSVIALFDSFVTDNFVKSLANAELLAVLVAAFIIGMLLKPGSAILKAVDEVDHIVTVIITWLIKAAPYGVFSLILANIQTLDLASMAESLGWLIAGALTNFFLHLLVVLPIVFFIFTRMNPWTFWLSCSPAWITAWGSASSAGTLPVTIRVVRKMGVPEVINEFAVPLGCLINMDGTAIYFPIAVTFLARTQGQSISVVDYIIVICLSTLAAIGTTPIPSASLVLIIMIANSINVQLTGMFAVIIAIDWFLDRFRTALNVSGDCFAAKIIEKQTGITDSDVANATRAAEKHV